MSEITTAFVGLDVQKDSIAIAVAGRRAGSCGTAVCRNHPIGSGRSREGAVACGRPDLCATPEAVIGRLYFGSIVPLDRTSPSFPARRRRHSTQSDEDSLPTRSSAMEWFTKCRTRRDSGKIASGTSATGPI